MKILVTGSSGQIGKNLIKSLSLDKTNTIVGFDIVPPDGDILDCNLFDFFHVDLTNKDSISKVKGVIFSADCVVHLASSIENSRNIFSLESMVEKDVASTMNLLSCIGNSTYFIYSSSMMIYGHPSSTPINEVHDTKPENMYGICKLYTELLLDDIRQNKAISIASLRFTGIYGTGEYFGDSKKRAIPSFINRIKSGLSPEIYSDPTEKRDYLYIGDAIDAIIKCIKYRYNGSLNIGFGTSVTIAKLAQVLCSLINKKITPDIKFKGVVGENSSDYALDISRAHKEIFFVPKVDIEEGLKMESERFE